jgi:hypothetical protein
MFDAFISRVQIQKFTTVTNKLFNEFNKSLNKDGMGWGWGGMGE